jgi:hypothetical protein
VATHLLVEKKALWNWGAREVRPVCRFCAASTPLQIELCPLQHHVEVVVPLTAEFREQILAHYKEVIDSADGRVWVDRMATLYRSCGENDGGHVCKPTQNFLLAAIPEVDSIWNSMVEERKANDSSPAADGAVAQEGKN